MKLFKTILAATVLTAFAGVAQAQMGDDTGTYMNLGVSSESFDSFNVTGRLGYAFSENFSAEGQGSFGVLGDSKFLFPKILGKKKADVKTDNSFAGFMRGVLPLSDQFGLSLRAGYHFTQVGTDAGDVGTSIDTDGFAYGTGVEFWFSETGGIRGDFTIYELGDSTPDSGEVWSAAYVRKF